ncbi:hypothetical protein GEMRC1_013896 [Eukaryota sp. GEM-RC1]
MSIFTFVHDSALHVAQESSLLTDFEIIFKSTHLHCHKAIVFQFFNRIASTTQQQYIIPEDEVEGSIGDLLSIIQSFYGCPLSLSEKNSVEVYELARHFKFTDLAMSARLVLKEFSPTTFQIPTSTLLTNLAADNFTDFVVQYHDQAFNTHRFLLATVIPYFNQLFADDPSTTFLDLSQHLTIDSKSLVLFFQSVYAVELSITLENVVDLFSIASFFNLNELRNHCCNLLQSSSPSVNWICGSITNADLDSQILELLASKLVKLG